VLENPSIRDVYFDYIMNTVVISRSSDCNVSTYYTARATMPATAEIRYSKIEEWFAFHIQQEHEPLHCGFVFADFTAGER